MFFSSAKVAVAAAFKDPARLAGTPYVPTPPAPPVDLTSLELLAQPAAVPTAILRKAVPGLGPVLALEVVARAGVADSPGPHSGETIAALQALPCPPARRARTSAPCALPLHRRCAAFALARPAHEPGQVRRRTGQRSSRRDPERPVYPPLLHRPFRPQGVDHWHVGASTGPDAPHARCRAARPGNILQGRTIRTVRRPVARTSCRQSRRGWRRSPSPRMEQRSTSRWISAFRRRRTLSAISRRPSGRRPPAWRPPSGR